MIQLKHFCGVSHISPWIFLLSKKRTFTVFHCFPSPVDLLGIFKVNAVLLTAHTIFPVPSVKTSVHDPLSIFIIMFIVVAFGMVV